MMIFLDKGLVIFATPKTASTSIERALGTVCDIRLSRTPNAKHTPFRKYKRFLEPFVMTLTGDAPDTVAMIREPIDWLGSWYRYRGRPEIAGRPASTADLSFDQFVEAYLQDEQPEFAHVGSQSRFLCDNKGQLGPSFLYCYEDVQSMVQFLETRLEQRLELGHMNVSPAAALNLSTELEARLRDVYRADFDLYERFRK